MSLDDIRSFAPILIILLCLVVGRLLKTSSKVPNWMIPPILTTLGLVSGCASQIDAGADWRPWLRGALLGIISGAAATGVHQNFQMLTGKANAVAPVEHGKPSVKPPPMPPPVAAAMLAFAFLLIGRMTS